MDLNDIIYSREAAIAAVADYYKFLTRMYLNESHVAYPPAGGWSATVNADAAALQCLGKSDEVLALMAHLPYLSEQTGEDLPLFTEGMLAKISPPNVLSLVQSRDQPVVLDTELGIIHWEDCPHRLNWGNDACRASVDWDRDDEVSPEENDWRHYAPTWEIADFFEVLKDQFVKLDRIPISHYEVRANLDRGWPHEEGMMDALQAIYWQNGWPDLDAYRKEECLEAVLCKLMADKYPASACTANPRAGLDIRVTTQGP